LRSRATANHQKNREAAQLPDPATNEMVQMLTTWKECDPIKIGQKGQAVNLLFLAF
jgi:hypothetical protein